MKRPILIASGQFNYDIISLRTYPRGFGARQWTEEPVAAEAGGTCGNVLARLAALGWNARPQIKLWDGDGGRKLAESLAARGCDCRYVTFSEKGGFCGLRVTHRYDQLTGLRKRSISTFGPKGRFGAVRELRVRDEVPEFLASVEETPQVYFFDRPMAGPRALAEEFGRRGAMVVYECEGLSDPAAVAKAVRAAHIIKFSDENVPDVGFCAEFPDKLFIQTLGSEGIRFSLYGAPWVHIPAAVPPGEVVDTEGCGDAVTAVLIDKLGRNYASNLTAPQVREALTQAAKAGALCATHLAPKPVRILCDEGLHSKYLS